MGKFNDYVFWLKNRCFRPNSIKVYNRALDYCNLPVKERINESFEKRQTLVNYAYEHCGFYRQFYNQVGFNPKMLQTEDDWEKVPILEKSMIARNIDSLVSDICDKSRLSVSSTGGTTGSPVKLYKSPKVHFEVLGWRSLGWWGISPADNEAILHRKVPVTFISRLRNRLLWWPTKRAYLSATAVTDGNIEDFLSELQKKKIKWIVGYCASLEYVADYILENKLRIEGIKLVWSTSSPLTNIVRLKIERAFGCKVMDQYGCGEVPHIAIQKPGENYLTVNADYVHVDIVNEKQIVSSTNEYGDVLITDLNTFEFPLIKYKLGDMSRMVMQMEESSDGFPKMDFIKGRISDNLIIPDGTRIDGDYLTSLGDSYYDSISCYQIHQKMDYSIEIYLVVYDKENSDEVKVKFIQDLQKIVKNRVPVSAKIVKKIPDFAGKRKFIISEIVLAQINS